MSRICKHCGEILSSVFVCRSCSMALMGPQIGPTTIMEAIEADRIHMVTTLFRQQQLSLGLNENTTPTKEQVDILAAYMDELAGMTYAELKALYQGES